MQARVIAFNHDFCIIADGNFMEIFVYRPDSEKIEDGFTAEDLPELLDDEISVVWVDFLGVAKAG
jgi:hypothetical protein